MALDSGRSCSSCFLAESFLPDCEGAGEGSCANYLADYDLRHVHIEEESALEIWPCHGDRDQVTRAITWFPAAVFVAGGGAG